MNAYTQFLVNLLYNMSAKQSDSLADETVTQSCIGCPVPLYYYCTKRRIKPFRPWTLRIADCPNAVPSIVRCFPSIQNGLATRL